MFEKFKSLEEEIQRVDRENKDLRRDIEFIQQKEELEYRKKLNKETEIYEEALKLKDIEIEKLKAQVELYKSSSDIEEIKSLKETLGKQGINIVK